jgi:hypothetical protein
MFPFAVFDSVQPTDKDHPRATQAGFVIALNPKFPDTVVVRWDTDNAETAEKFADLRKL